MHKEILEDIGEKELINRLGKFMPKNQASDDCALIKTKNETLLINNDSFVENVHFNDIIICPHDLGWKAVVSNISDLLSSGSKRTIGITISLILPAKTEWVWVEELYKGIKKSGASFLKPLPQAFHLARKVETQMKLKWKVEFHLSFV